MSAAKAGHMTRRLGLALMVAWCGLAAADWYVAPGGDDGAPGTKDSPFATLERARDAVRAARRDSQAQRGPAVVFLREGRYPRRESFLLTKEDSGRADAPVVYRAYPGERVVLTGGQVLTGFTPVTDAAVLARIPEPARSNVRQADLRAQGVSDFGVMKMRGFPQPVLPAPLELFFDGEPMTMARWPNEGWAKTGPIVDPGSVPREGDDSNRPGTFEYVDDRPARWAQAEDVWMFGYWCWDWADESIEVAAIDTEQRQVHLAAPHHYGLKEGMRYYAFNLLEELDEPGEWYLNRETALLYFWPPGPLERGTATVSLLEAPMLILDDVQHVAFEGLVLECMRGTAVRILGGSHIRLAGCTVRNIGNVGAILGEGGSETDIVGLLGCSVFARSYQDTMWNRHAGTGHVIDDCEFYNLGEGGVILGGGDRATLEPGGNSVVNCHFYNYSRSVTTNRPAVWMDGVGNRVAYTCIHDAPHTAIMYWGNDHRIEFNEFFDVCKETGDVGVIYTGRDWTMRGTVVRYNYIHDVHGPGHGGAQAIYLDDQASGTIATGNVIVNVARAFLIGGGRDNRVENNILVDCPQSVHLDARGVGWAGDNQDIMEKRLQATPYEAAPWATRYPALAAIREGEPPEPRGNVVRNNVLLRCGEMNIHGLALQHGTVESNIEPDGDAGFVDAANGDYRLRADSPVLERLPSFVPIPFEQIGRRPRAAEEPGQ
ncbi:MAG: right-handed parallel beta-helix repeat-containing protein [Candidatus Hydrogenedentes bacterium]|nr:right-handed parallel beta-helix repeat-containing protein [Candidatus Hydrogenedentota bacterium]